MDEYRLVVWLLRALIIGIFCVATVFWFIYEHYSDRMERFRTIIEEQLEEADPDG